VLPGRPRKRPDFADTNQYRAYENCLLQHFRAHRWLAYIDADEFFVFPQQQHHSTSSQQELSSSGSSSSSSQAGPSMQGQGLSLDSQQQQGQMQSSRQGQDALEQHAQHAASDNQQGAAGVHDLHPPNDLPGTLNPTSSTSNSSSSSMGSHNLAVFLADFESHAAVGMNWVLFGSSGHLVRPTEGPLAAYTTCIPQTHWESTHVKVRGGMLQASVSPCGCGCHFIKSQ
jgi:hypothetical protein